MSCRSLLPVSVSAAVLLLGIPARAGQPVRTPVPPKVSSAPVAPAVPLRATVSVVVSGASRVTDAADAVYVDIRGPDGQVRRFPVEGGRAAIEVQEVVLRAGRSVTIHLPPVR